MLDEMRPDLSHVVVHEMFPHQVTDFVEERHLAAVSPWGGDDDVGAWMGLDDAHVLTVVIQRVGSLERQGEPFEELPVVLGYLAECPVDILLLFPTL